MKRYRVVSLVAAAIVPAVSLAMARVGQAATPQDLAFHAHMAHTDYVRATGAKSVPLAEGVDDTSVGSSAETIPASDRLRHKLIYVQ